MQVDEISKLVARQITDARVSAEDLTGGGDHFLVTVVSPQFERKTLIEQHRLVQNSLHEALDDGRIHALQIKTLTPAESDKQKPGDGTGLNVVS